MALTPEQMTDNALYELLSEAGVQPESQGVSYLPEVIVQLWTPGTYVTSGVTGKIEPRTRYIETVCSVSESLFLDTVFGQEPHGISTI